MNELLRAFEIIVSPLCAAVIKDCSGTRALFISLLSLIDRELDAHFYRESPQHTVLAEHDLYMTLE
jgi:hypothetical protein